MVTTPARSYASIAAYVDPDRLWQRHMQMAELGATPAGGVKRLALGSEDNQARRVLVDWGRSLGFESFLDPIGNLFIRRPGQDLEAAPVVSGSHTDTQPSGGRFDGIYGVLAVFEALEAIQQAGISTRRSIEAVVWTCEEGGARFPLGTMGSSVFTGVKSLAEALAVQDDDGVTVAAALKSTQDLLSDVPTRALGFPVASFVEAHIEQGPVLEDAQTTIGVVTGIQGIRRFVVDVIGENAHAGTTSRARRQDALSAAVAMITALEGIFHDPEDIVRFTVGRFRVQPDAPAVVPGRVTFTIDFRHPDAHTLQDLGDRIDSICQAHRRQCQVKVQELSHRLPVHFSNPIPDLIESVAQDLNHSHLRIFSGAGHDAMHLAQVCPTGMIFVPCENGVSHTEVENASPQDLAAGAQVLAASLVALAQEE